MYNYGDPFEEEQWQPPLWAPPPQNFAPFAVDELPAVDELNNPAVQQQQPLHHGIVVSLRTPDTWNNLNAVGNEMEVATNGRLMDPKLEYDLAGLDPTKTYSIHVYFERMNRNFMTYEDGVWNEEFVDVNGVDPMRNVPERTNAISLGIASGSYWSFRGIHSKYLKIFNPPRRCLGASSQVREQDAARILRNEQTMINVRTMCRYVPVIEIYEFVGAHNFLCHTAIFDETKFVAVSSYRNKNLKELKKNGFFYISANTNGTRPTQRRRSDNVPRGKNLVKEIERLDTLTKECDGLIQKDSSEEEEVKRKEYCEKYGDFSKVREDGQKFVIKLQQLHNVARERIVQ
ncbi:unnamed protein product [Caenorhabditis sp. 36 PRJEB53466]|nr:unnamed protein product [Caenorhabditis sp. 36 PRJEB53466]